MKGRGAWLPCLLLASGCASLGSPAAPPEMFSGGEGHYLRDVPAVAQRADQCGPASLESVLRYWGRPVDPEALRQALVTPGTRGVLNFTLASHPRTLGIWTEVHQAGRDDLRAWLQRGIPPIVMLRVGPWGLPKYHYAVVRGFNDREGVYYANTGEAVPRAIRYAAFERRWRQAQSWCLIVVPADRVDWTLPAAQRFELATLHLRARNWDAAGAIYRDMLREAPDSGPVSNNLAWIAVEAGKPEEAIRLIEHAFAAGAARDYDILDTLGIAYCRRGQPQAAQALFREALGRVPGSRAGAAALIQRHAEECGSAGSEFRVQ